MIDELFTNLEETEDVGQRRYLMYSIFDKVLEKRYSGRDQELPEPDERVELLQDFDGYLYKLAQDFLTSSSTLEKREKLNDMKEHIL